MKTFEIVVETPHESAREALVSEAIFVRRTQVEDAYFENGRGDTARLRRQDTITRLSCTRPLDDIAGECPETIVLDYIACVKLLIRFGFQEAAREKYVRETWKRHHYALHLDRFPDAPARLTLEAEAWAENERRMKRQALTFLKSIGISCKIRLPKNDARPVDAQRHCEVDKPRALPYTAPILRGT